MNDIDKVMAKAMKAEGRRRAKLLRARTLGNPRFYVLLLVSVLLLPVSLPIWLVTLLGEWMQKGADATEQFFIRLLAPFNRWVDAGARKDGDA